MPEDQEQEFTFVDKRRVSAEGEPEPKPQPAAEPAAPEAPQPDTAAEEVVPDLPALAMRDRFLMCIDILHQGAWIAMGLVADPATGEINRDMPNCKRAIDSVEYLVGQVSGDVDDSLRREMQTLVGNLKINYANQARR